MSLELFSQNNLFALFPTFPITIAIFHTQRRCPSIKLKELRKNSNMTQAELAKLSGISQCHLSCMERGEKQPTLPILKRLAVALKISVAELIDDDDQAV